MAFEVVRADRLSPQLLTGLLDFTIGAVRIKDFLSEEDCARAIERSRAKRPVRPIETLDPKALLPTPLNGKFLGLTRMHHGAWNDPEGKEKYFAQVAEQTAARKEITGDALEKLISETDRAWPQGAKLAVEESTQEPYFAGQIRIVHGAVPVGSRTSGIHKDWPNPDGRNWTVEAIDAILTWNVYLQVSEVGGELKIYERRWLPEDDARFTVPGKYGYDPAVVEGSSCIEISPERGEIILFNPQRFHDIVEATGTTERVTLTSFIGRHKDTGTLLFWC